VLLTAKVISHASRPSRPSLPSRPNRPSRPSRQNEVQQSQRNTQLRNDSSTSHSEIHARNPSPPTSMAIDIDEIDLTYHPSDDESLPPLEEILVLRPRQVQRQPEIERQGFISPDGS